MIFITHSMEEAVLLGDRVVLLSARPGRISEIVEVPLKTPPFRCRRFDREFARVCRDHQSPLEEPARDAGAADSGARVTTWQPAAHRWRIRFPFGATLITVLVTAALWEIAARLANVSFIPPLGNVLGRLWQLTIEGQILDDLTRSLTNLLIGFAISVVFGTAIGVAMGLSKKVEAALDIYVYALLTTPTLIFAPVFFAIWGLSSGSIIALIVLYAILYIIINTAAAMDSAPTELLEMARSFNTPRRLTFMRIRLPAALPLILAGYRVAVARAVRGMINGEMFIAATGLGALVIQAGARFDATTVLAVLILIIAIAYAAIELVGFIDRRLTGWLPSNERVGGF